MQADVIGRVVETVGTEYALTLGLSDGSAISIETLFELTLTGSPPSVVDPQAKKVNDEEQAAALLGRIIVSADIDADTGLLSIGFDDGTRLKVRSDADYEAWAITQPDGATIVALPGGGVRRWGAQD